MCRVSPVGAGAGSSMSGGLTPDTALYVREVPVTGGSVARSMVSKLVGLFVSTALIVAFFIALTPIIKSNSNTTPHTTHHIPHTTYHIPHTTSNFARYCCLDTDVTSVSGN
jgi:hypothetical protein